MTVEKISYQGWSQCYRVSNGEVELLLVADIGPRILRYGFAGGQNLLKEVESDWGKTGGDEFRLYGGSRIWIAPEDRVRSYGTDNFSCDVTVNERGLRAVAPPERETGIQKEIEVEMAGAGAGVVVRYRLTNKTNWPLDLSPWALTMMAPGGVGIAPFPPRGTHPEMLAPTHPLVMFAFTNLSDERWTLLEKYILLRQDPALPDPEKIGLFHPQTRGAYLLDGELFVKKYEAVAGADYPDMGASYETFANDSFLELETLGPIVKLEPNEGVDHVERWSLHRGVELREFSDAEIDRVVAPLLK